MTSQRQTDMISPLVYTPDTTKLRNKYQQNSRDKSPGKLEKLAFPILSEFRILFIMSQIASSIRLYKGNVKSVSRRSLGPSSANGPTRMKNFRFLTKRKLRQNLNCKKGKREEKLEVLFPFQNDRNFYVAICQ